MVWSESIKKGEALRFDQQEGDQIVWLHIIRPMKMTSTHSGFVDPTSFFCNFRLFLMTFKIDLNTGPNHQYSDLEAEKLVYKLLILVLDHRVSF